MQLRSVALAALLAATLSAHADTVALWDYNATPTTTKHAFSANGASFSTLNGVTTTFAGGVAFQGSAAGQALNTAGYAGQGLSNMASGVQFMIDTSGYTDLVLNFAQRNSTTASAYTALLYTVDGSSWSTATTFLIPVPSNPASPSFTSGLTFDFSGITAANNNPDFGIRFVAAFAPDTSTYVSTVTRLAGDYRTTGTIRYDNVLLSGTALPDVDPAPIPEPQTYALMLAGLAVVSLMARRRTR